MPAPGEITRLLRKYQEGDPIVLEALTPLVYEELKQIARSRLRRERSNHSLQPTALVHEAFLRLVDQKERGFENRHHFFFFASHLMRQILVDHARMHTARKRGGDAGRVSLVDAVSPGPSPWLDVLILDQALTRLAASDQRKARVVELRYFGGLSVNEIADTMKASERTVARDMRVAMAWLHREMASHPPAVEA